MHHDVVDGEITQIQHAAEHVAVILDHPAFLMVQGDGAAQLVMGGEDRTFHLEAEQAHHAAHDELHPGHDRTEEAHNDGDWSRDGEGEPVRVRQGVGFRQDLGEDQDQEGHDQRGPENGIAAKHPFEQLADNHRGGDIDQVIAEQDRAQQAFPVGDQTADPSGGEFRLLVAFQLQHARFGGCGQRGLRTGEEGRQAQQAEDHQGGADQAPIEAHLSEVSINSRRSSSCVAVSM